MADKDTVIVVGITRLDEYENLWITPQGGGDEVKIGVKRAHLHPLFEQGKAVLLHWETYKGKAYVADAKLVEGELPPPLKPYEPSTIIKPIISAKDQSIEAEVAIKSITELWAADKLVADHPLVIALKIWLSEKLNPYMMPQTPRVNAVDSTEWKQVKIEPPVGVAVQSPPGRVFFSIEPQTFAELRAWAVGHGKEFTLTWMVNSLKILEEVLRSDPNGAYHTIKDKMGWTD